MTHDPRKTSAILELTVAGALWGFGFIAATWALRGMGPLSITGWRFFLAACIGLSLSMLRSSTREAQLNLAQFRLAFLPGMLISATLILQTWGLRYTTATKSGFITTLYVLMVPLLEMGLLKRKLPRLHLAFVLVALFGVLLICDLHATRLNRGDLLTFGCAILATLHILWFGKIGNKIGSAFAFNNFQSVWACAIPLVLSFIFEPWPTPNFQDQSLIGLFMLVFGSTLIAFALQVRAQKHIAPSLASLLFLLESPFSALFALTFLGEGLAPLQWLGGGLILLAAALSLLFASEVEQVPSEL